MQYAVALRSADGSAALTSGRWPAATRCAVMRAVSLSSSPVDESLTKGSFFRGASSRVAKAVVYGTLAWRRRSWSLVLNMERLWV